MSGVEVASFFFSASLCTIASGGEEGRGGAGLPGKGRLSCAWKSPESDSERCPVVGGVAGGGREGSCVPLGRPLPVLLLSDADAFTLDDGCDEEGGCCGVVALVVVAT